MRTRFAVMAFLSAVTFLGCKNPQKSGLFSGPVAPTLQGAWNGAFQMGSVTPSMQMDLNQTNINVRGNYSAPTVSGATIGDAGTIRGLTTGQSFTLTFTASTPGCVAKIDINGFNSGTELAYNFTGVDCSCMTVTGQGYAERPH